MNNGENPRTTENSDYHIFFPAGIDLESILKAAYRFSDYLVVDFTGDSTSECILRRKDSKIVDQSLADEFRQSVIDYQLRQTIRMQTESERLLVLSAAFSRILKANLEETSEEPNSKK